MFGFFELGNPTTGWFPLGFQPQKVSSKNDAPNYGPNNPFLGLRRDGRHGHDSFRMAQAAEVASKLLQDAPERRSRYGADTHGEALEAGEAGCQKVV